MNFTQRMSFSTARLNPLDPRHIPFRQGLKHLRAGKYKPSRSGISNLLSYEMANPPENIGSRKGFLATNCSNLLDGVEKSRIVWEDEFIRKFVEGTWLSCWASEIVIKRKSNCITVCGFIHRKARPESIYFLIGYTEEILTNFLRQIVKMHIQSVERIENVVFKRI